MPEQTSNERKSHFSSTSTISRSTTSNYSLSPKEVEHQRRLSNATLFTPTRAIHLQSTIKQKRSSKSSLIDDMTESKSVSTYSSRTAPFTELRAPTDNDSDDIGLEIIESQESRQQKMRDDGKRINVERSSILIEDYGENDSPLESSSTPSPPSIHALPRQEETSKRSLSSSIFLLEIGVLIVVLILSMVLVLAIREDQANLRTTMQLIYTYIYVVSIAWLVWCALDIIRFRRQWMKLTSSVDDQEMYMDIVERHPHSVSYFPDKHNTGGLFMRIGAGLLCMGSLLLTVIELAKTIETLRIDPNQLVLHSANFTNAVYITQSITYLFRFLFHCVQFTFLFRYGNIIIDRYHLLAKMGLIHVIIANFCTWFEAIVFETVEELHKHNTYQSSTSTPMISNTTTVISEAGIS